MKPLRYFDNIIHNNNNNNNKLVYLLIIVENFKMFILRLSNPNLFFQKN